MIEFSSTNSAMINLKCTFCNNFLSVPPIYHNGLQTACGRCVSQTNLAKEAWHRQYVYEIAAKHLIFPCRYAASRCTAKLRWNEVEKHESVCIRRPVDCVLANADFFSRAVCRWTGELYQLEKHVKDSHEHLVEMSEEFKFADITANRLVFTRYAGQLAIVAVKLGGPERFSFLVSVFGKSDEYRYQLKLYDGLRDNEMIMRRHKVEEVTQLEECLKDPERTINVDLRVVRKFLKNPVQIMGKISVLKKSRTDLAATYRSDSLRRSRPVIDDNFLQELECPVCKFYLLEPIYVCELGHSLCQSCMGKVQTCPTCRGKFAQSRNVALEKLTAVLNYPCVNRSIGCFVLSDHSNVRLHEKKCAINMKKCPFDCPVSECNLFEHLDANHRRSIIKPGEINSFDIDKSPAVFAMFYRSNVFSLRFGHEGKLSLYIDISVEQHGVKYSYYYFNIQFIDSRDHSRTVSHDQNCLSLSPTSYSSVSYSKISEFVSDEGLVHFRAHPCFKTKE